MTVEGSLTIDDGVTLSLRRLGNGSASITVSSGGSLIFLGTSANQISGNSSTNTVTVSAGATLITANSNGIRGAATSSFVPAANQLTTTLDVAANYVFNGADQTTTGLPSTVNNLTLSGSGTKTLNAATTVNGNFVMAGTASFSTAADLTLNNALTVGDGSNAVSFTAGAFALTVTGNTTVAANSTLTINSATGTKAFNGDVSVAGTWNNTTANVALTLPGSLAVTGAFNAGTGTHTFTGTGKTISGTLTIPNVTNSGSYTNTGSLTVSTALSGTGSITQGSNATLNLSGTFGITGFTATASGNTVNYSGAAQTIRDVNYHHLTFSGSNAKTMGTGTTSIAGNLTFSGTASATAVTGLTIGGNMTIGTGTAFSASTFTHNVAGNWSQSGTFNANTSTILFNGSGTTQAISGTNNFNNLTISRAGSGIVTATGSTLTVSGTLNVTAGTFAGASTYGNVTIASGATLESEPNGTINVTGNWTNNGTFTANNGTVVFTGTSPQSIGGDASTTFYNLTMGGTGLKTLGISTSVSNLLTMTSGILDIGTHTLTAGNTSGGSASSYVKTSGTGRLKQYVNYQGTRNFPIGNSAYNPVSVTNNTQGGGDNFYFRVTDDAVTNANDITKTLTRKWLLGKDNTSPVNLILAISFNADDAREGNFDTGTTPRLGFYNGTYWSYTTASASGNTTYTATAEILSLNATEAFIAVGKDDAFSASKFGVTIFPQSPQVGTGGGIITVLSVNSAGIPTLVQEATTFAISAVNTTDPLITTEFTAAALQGVIAAGSYDEDITLVNFTSATTDQTGPSQVKASKLASGHTGEILADGLSATFNVSAGRIFEPKKTGNWSDPSNWRYSQDGGSTWRDTTAYPSATGVTDLIRIPVKDLAITLTADVTASFYSFFLETGATLILPNEVSLTLLHPTGNISGYDVHVHGTFKNTGGTFLNKDYGDTTNPDPETTTYPNAIPGSTYPIEMHGGVYWHARDGGSVPLATWESLGTTPSTCIIDGSNVGGLNQDYENFTLASGTSSLSGDMTISGVLALTAGKITTENYRVTTTLTATIADNPGGWINGYLKRIIPAGSNVSALFPVGDAQYYAPVTLAAGSVSQSGSMEVSTVQLTVTPPVASGLSGSKYIKRKWNTANQGIIYSNATATWTFNDSDEVGMPGTVYLRRLASGTWYATGGTTVASESNTITLSGLAYLGESASSEMYIGESTCDVANVWFGSFDTNWHDARNWCGGVVPNSSTHVLIPGGITRYPVISDAAAANNLEIMSGGSLTMTGAYTLSVHGNLANAGTYTAGTGTLAMVGTSQQTITGPVTFNNLTINNVAGVVAGSDFTVNGTLYAQSANPSATQGALHMGTYTVFMGPNATNTGDGDVTGTTTRNHVFVLNTFYTYGHKHTGSRYFVATSLPTSVSLRVSIGAEQPGWKGTPTGFANPLQRKYEPAQTGGENMRVYSRFFYKQSEVPDGTDESILAVWVQYPGPSYQDRGWFDYDVENNWLSISDESFTTIPSSLGTVQIAIAPTSFTLNTWLGGNSSDWNTASNWSQDHVPLATEGVVIPNASTTTYDPELPSSPAAVAKFLILQPGSILNGGNGTITVYNDQVANVWSAETGSPSAGLFNAGTSTVIIDSQISFADISGATDFYNLSIPAGSKVRIGDDARTGIVGTLTLAGTLDAATTHNTIVFKGAYTQQIPNPNYPQFPGYHELIFSGSGTKELPATLNVGCNLVNNGSFNANNGTVIINTGYHNKELYIGGDNSSVFHNLTINSSPGVQLRQNITVNGTLHLQAANPSATKGSMDVIAGKAISLGAGATVTGTGDITGTVTRSHVFQNGVFFNMTSANNWMVFTDLPNQSGNPLTVSVNLQIGAAPSWSGCSGSISNPVNRVYTAWATGTWGESARGNLRLRYLTSEISGGVMPYTLSVWRKTGISPSCTVSELGKSNQDYSNNNLGIALLKMNDFATTEGDMEFAIAPSAYTYLTWTGGAGTRNALTAGNWSPSGLPSASNRLYIPVANSLPTDAGVYRTPLLADGETLAAYSIELQDGGEITAVGNSTINLNGTGAVWISGANAILKPGSSTVNINTPGENSFVGTIAFHNVDIKTGVSFFATNNVNITIGGTLTNSGTIFAQTAGNTFNFAGSNQTIPNTSEGVANYRTLVVSGSGTVLPVTLNLNGNFTYSGSGMVTAGSTLTMMGNTAQTIGGTASATFNNLSVNNAAGVTLGNSQTVSGTLTLTNGLVNTGIHTLTMGASGTISGASSSRHINGKLANVYSGTGSKTFPTGKSGNYRPVTLAYTILSGTSTVTVEQIESVLPGTLPAGTTIFNTRHWQVTQTGDAGTYDITLDGTGYSPYSTSNVVILKGDGTTNEKYTATYSSLNYTTTALESFSYFGLGEFGTFWKGFSTNWYDGTNWSTGAAPDANAAITIPASLTNYPVISSLDADVTIGPDGFLSLEAGTTVTLEAGPVLTFEPGATVTTDTGAKIILQSDARYLNLGTGTPTLEVQRILTGDKGWRMVASPVNTTYADMFKLPLVTQGFTGTTNTTLQPNLLWWNEKDGGSTLQSWRTIANIAHPDTAGRGYFYYVFNGALKPSSESEYYTDAMPVSMTATGVENYNGIGYFSFTVTKTARTVNPTQTSTTDATAYAANEGWNLVGNPTASTLYWDAASGWTKTNVDNSIYVWDPSTNEYKTWNGTTGTLGSGNIPPFQAFWVKANAVSPALSFDNNAKTSVTGTFLKNAEISASINIPISLKGLEMVTTAFLSLSESGVAGEDPYDAYRLQPMSDSWLALYMKSSPSANLPLVINNLPHTFEGEILIPLYVDAQEAGQKVGGSFELQWQVPENWPAELSLALMDHIRKKAIDMLSQTTYGFSQAALKSGIAAAIDPLALPANLVGPLVKNGEANLKSAQSHPFSIVIGKGGNETTYVEAEPMLLPVYPNPFGEYANITFRIPEKGSVRVDVFDMTGRMVATPVTGDYEAGLHREVWVPGRLVPGIYVVRLTSGTTVRTQKIVR